MKKFIICLCLVLISGCASYSSSFQKVEVLLSQQKPKEALAQLELKPQTGKNKLLYLLDKAMLQRMSGLHSQSNETFEQAKTLMEKLSVTSVTEQAAALAINDSMMSYEGEDYEQVAVHLFEALNYINLDLWDEARVEALQVDMRLKIIAQDNDVKFEEHAFSRYLTGIIYEQGKEWGDAMIAYRKAYQTYQKQKQPIPLFLKQDLIRLSQEMGLEKEHKEYKKSFAMDDGVSAYDLSKQGEVMVLLHQSLAPIKRSSSIFVSGAKKIEYRISLPIYQSRPTYVSSAVLTVGDKSAKAVVVNDFDHEARKSLARATPAMTARLLARAIVKKTAAKTAEKSNGNLAGLLVDVAGMVTETADTRSWLTLPKNIHFARLPIQAGTYPAKLTLLGKSGAVVRTINLGQLDVKNGKKVVLEQTFVKPFVKVQ
ncbi:MAG: hypothetical protein R8M46_00185 [Ghiorsea sp.]